jgi:hypothetical protein
MFGDGGQGRSGRGRRPNLCRPSAAHSHRFVSASSGFWHGLPSQQDRTSRVIGSGDPAAPCSPRKRRGQAAPSPATSPVLLIPQRLTTPIRHGAETGLGALEACSHGSTCEPWTRPSPSAPLRSEPRLGCERPGRAPRATTAEEPGTGYVPGRTSTGSGIRLASSTSPTNSTNSCGWPAAGTSSRRRRFLRWSVSMSSRALRLAAR